MENLKEKFKEVKQQEIPERVKIAINTHLEKQGKPIKFEIPPKK